MVKMQPSGDRHARMKDGEMQEPFLALPEAAELQKAALPSVLNAPRGVSVTVLSHWDAENTQKHLLKTLFQAHSAFPPLCNAPEKFYFMQREHPFSTTASAISSSPAPNRVPSAQRPSLTLNNLPSISKQARG